ncbi:MAG: hypothetical protein KDE27_27740 [Planctomycetes bacterium]|nr:hypothetical protein [Planctomycetota bacterium]
MRTASGTLLPSLVWSFLLASAAARAQSQLPLPPSLGTFTSTTGGIAYGLWFDVPANAADLRIRGLRIPGTTAGSQRFLVKRFATSPPSGPGTNIYSLYWNGPSNAAVLPTDIALSAGDTIAVFGTIECSSSSSCQQQELGQGGFVTSACGLPFTLQACSLASFTAMPNQVTDLGAANQLGLVEVYLGTARSEAYGTPCQDRSLFYELMPSNTWFDLGGKRVTLRPSGRGYRVDVGFDPGGWYPTTTAVTWQLIGGQSVSPRLPLGFTMQLPGAGTGNDIQVHADGTIWPTMDTGFFGAGTWAAQFLVPRGPVWVPRRGGLTFDSPGVATFDRDPANGAAYLTFTNAQLFPAGTGAMSLQVAFFATGEVQYRYGVVPTSIYPALVGWNARAPQAADPGSTDLTMAAPFRTSIPIRLRADRDPHLGVTVPLTCSSIAGPGTLGATALGLTRFDPGLSLDPIGMPGCHLYTSVDASVLWVSPANTARYDLNLSGNPSLVGTTIAAQAFALETGANALDVLASNGVELHIGF